MVKETFLEVTNHFKDDFPILDPLKEMKINDPTLESYIKKYNSLKEQRDKTTKQLNEIKIDVPKSIKDYEKKVK